MCRGSGYWGRISVEGEKEWKKETQIKGEKQENKDGERMRRRRNKR